MYLYIKHKKYNGTYTKLCMYICTKTFVVGKSLALLLDTLRILQNLRWLESIIQTQTNSK